MGSFPPARPGRERDAISATNGATLQSLTFRALSRRGSIFSRFPPSDGGSALSERAQAYANTTLAQHLSRSRPLFAAARTAASFSAAHVSRLSFTVASFLRLFLRRRRRHVRSVGRPRRAHSSSRAADAHKREPHANGSRLRVGVGACGALLC